MFTNTQAVDVRIDVIDRKTDEVVDSITKDAQEPNVEHSAGGTARSTAPSARRPAATTSSAWGR